MQPTKQMTVNTNGEHAFTAPEGFRPAHSAFAVCQGLGLNRWFLMVYSDGRALAARYGKQAYETIETDSHMPFGICYSTA